MTDVLTKKQRSYNMSRIRGKWTKQEMTVHNYLKGRKIKHKMHPDLPGKPDILLEKTNTVIFLDGCFWHKCPECFIMPATRREFWKNKIDSNVNAAKKSDKILRKAGYNVLRLWEHEIRKDRGKRMEKFWLPSERLKYTV